MSALDRRDATARAAPIVTFGDFCLDPANATLKRGATPIALTPKAFGVLEFLVARAGQLVTKDEFLDRLWPGVFVGDAVLKVCVREIRQALDDDHHEPTFIETVHKRGYRFVAAVTTVRRRRAPCRAPTPAEFAPPQTRYAQQRRRQHRLPGGRRRARSISCSSWAGSRTWTTSGPSRRSPASCAGSPRSRA